MVKCKYNHLFSSRRKSVKLKTSLKPVNEEVTTCKLMNNATQMVLTTTTQKFVLFSLPELNHMGEFPLQGTASVTFASSELPNQLIFGLFENNTLKLVHSAGEMVSPAAHAGTI